MDVIYDSAKSARNIKLRGLSSERAAEFDFQTALIALDDRRDYGETRHRALGFLDGRLYALVYVEAVNGIRVISFRKANKREVRRYEEATQP